MRELVELASRVAEIERRFSGMMRFGTVASVNPKKQTLRLKLGKDEDGKDFLSAHIPYGQTAGAMRFHNPPSVGQQMMMLSPSGDYVQAVALPFHWSENVKSPNDKGDEHMMTFGKATVHLKTDSLLIKIGGSEITLTENSITLKTDTIDLKGDLVHAIGKALKHNDKNVGDDHEHTDVEPGGGLTGPPA